MKALAIVMLVLGVLALGVFGLMQFRNIGEYEEQVERAEGPDEGFFNADSASPAEIKARKLEREAHLQESRDMLDLQKSLRLGGGLGAPIFLIGGAVLLRRRRKS